MIRLLLTALVILTAGSPALSFDLGTSRREGQAGTVSLFDPAPTELLLVAGPSLARGHWLVETGYDRQFELSDLDQFFAAAAVRFGRFTVGAGAAQFGNSDLYAEKTLRLTVAGHLSLISVGASWSGRQLEFGGDYESLSAGSFSVHAVTVQPRIAIGLTAENLTAPTFDSESGKVKPSISSFAEVKGHRSFSLLGRVTMQETARPQLAIAQRIALAERSTFFWGYGTEPSKFGAGISLRISRTTVTYAGSYHPVLGFSFTLSAMSGGGGAESHPGDTFAD